MTMTREETQLVKHLDSSYRKISMDPRDFVDEVLWHYTTAGGFYGIVKESKLRGTNARYMNDFQEVVYGSEMIEKILQGWKCGAAERAFLESTLRKLRALPKESEVFLACFSADPDQLSMWKAYGDEQGRICIGFDGDLEWATGHFARVVYEEADQRKKATADIRNALDAAREARSPSEGFLDKISGKLARRLREDACFFKNPGFAEKSEWRLVHQERMAFPNPRLKFSVASGRIRPFVDLGRWNQGEASIREVVIGPSAHMEEQRMAAAWVLNSLGHQGVEVKASAIPYRDI